MTHGITLPILLAAKLPIAPQDALEALLCAGDTGLTYRELGKALKVKDNSARKLVAFLKGKRLAYTACHVNVPYCGKAVEVIRAGFDMPDAVFVKAPPPVKKAKPPAADKQADAWRANAGAISQGRQRQQAQDRRALAQNDVDEALRRAREIKHAGWLGPLATMGA